MINCATEVSSVGVLGVFNTTVEYNKQFITLVRVEYARHFTLRLYFHSPAARENMAACSRNISPYSTLTHVISIIYLHKTCRH